VIGKPTPFKEAIAYLQGKKLMPTNLDSNQLAGLDAVLRRYATFSAQVSKAEILQGIADVAGAVVDPQYAGGAAGTAVDVPTARTSLLELLQSIGYEAEPGKEGTIQDLTSFRRLDLIVRTNTQMAQGLGQHVQANDPVVLDAFPAQELFRLQQRTVPRDWIMRWRGAGGHFYGGGRMIALKDDPIWGTISRFGNPYPPFDFNSGMWVKPVPRREAVQFGLIKEGQQVKPTDITPSSPLQASVQTFSKPILDALRESIPGASVQDGTLTTEE
jgi:hypothetical protein